MTKFIKYYFYKIFSRTRYYLLYRLPILLGMIVLLLFKKFDHPSLAWLIFSFSVLYAILASFLSNREREKLKEKPPTEREPYSASRMQFIFALLDIFLITAFIFSYGQKTTLFVFFYIVPLIQAGRNYPLTYTLPLCLITWFLHGLSIGTEFFTSLKPQVLADTFFYTFAEGAVFFLAVLYGNRDWKKRRRIAILRASIDSFKADTPDEFLKNTLEIARRYTQDYEEKYTCRLYLIDHEAQKIKTKYLLYEDTLQEDLPEEAIEQNGFVKLILKKGLAPKEEGISVASPEEAERKGMTLKENVGSELGQSFGINNRIMGIIDIKAQNKRVFTEDDKEILSVLCQPVGLGYKKLLLKQIETATLMEQYLPTLLNTILEYTQQMIPFENALVFTYDEDKDCMILEHVFRYKDPPFRKGYIFEKEKTISGNLANSGFIFYSNYPEEVEKYKTEFKFLDREEKSELRSYIGIRIEYKNATLGGLALISHKKNHFQRIDREILEEVGFYVGQAIYHLLTYQKDKLEAINKIGSFSTWSKETSDIYKKLGEEIRDVMKLNTVAIVSKENSRLKLKWCEGWDLGNLKDGQLEGGIVGNAALSKKTIYMPDTEDKQDPSIGIYRAYNLKTRSEVAVPMVDEREEVQGVINVEHDTPNRFSRGDIAFLEILARNVTNILEIKHLNVFLSKLHDLNEELFLAANLDTLLDKIALETNNIFKSDLVTIFEYDEKSKTFDRLRVYSGKITKESVDLLSGEIPSSHLVYHMLEKKDDRLFFENAQNESLLIDKELTGHSPDQPRFVEREGVKSTAILKLKTAEEIVGLMFVNFRNPHRFDEQEKKRLETFSMLTTTAIIEFKKKEEKIKESAERKRKLDIVTDFGMRLEKVRDKRELWKRVADETQKILGCEISAVFLYDTRTARLRRKAIVGYDDPERYEKWFEDETYIPGQAITGYPMKKEPFGEPINLPDEKVPIVEKSDLINREHRDKYKDHLKSRKINHIMVVPLNGSNRTFGVLRMVNKLALKDGKPQYDEKDGSLKLSTERFSDEDLEILRAIASQASVAYINIRRLEKIKKLNESIGIITSELNIDKICENVANTLVGDEFGYKGCFVRVRNEKSELFPEGVRYVDAKGQVHSFSDQEREKYKIGLTPEKAGSICEGVYWSAKFRYEKNVLDKTVNFKFKDLAKKYNFRSYLCLPLKIENEAVGTLGVLSGDLPYDGGQNYRCYEFYKEEQELLENFCAQVALATLNAESYTRLGAFSIISESIQTRESMLQAMQDILVGVTAKDGLGFNRAVMFRFLEDKKVFKELWAVGQMSKTEWEEAVKKIARSNLRELLGNSDHVTILQKQLEGVEIPLGMEALFKWVFENRKKVERHDFNNTGSENLSVDFYAKILPQDANSLSFAIVPMVVLNEVKGLIYVDNAFVPGKFIRSKAVDILNRFADFAASTIERFVAADRKQALELSESLVHNLLTPMSAICGWAETIQGKIAEKKLAEIDLKQIAERIHYNAWAADRMVKEILDVSRITYLPDIISRSKTILDVGILLDQIKREFPENFQKRIKMESELQLSIKGDEGLLKSAIVGIIDNALKYSRDAVPVKANSEGGQLIISVKDKGPGIEKQYLEKIFEKGFQIEDQRNLGTFGTGIGLFLAKRVVELHNGRIEVESEPDKGTIFKVILPLVQNV